MIIKIYKICLDNSHSLYMNDKKREFVVVDRRESSYSSDRFKFKVLDMISGWDNKMINPNIIDGIEYRIVIKENKKENLFIFKNKYPNDIIRLEALINEVVEVENDK